MDIIFDISAALRRLFLSPVCTYGQCTLRGGRLLGRCRSGVGTCSLTELKLPHNSKIPEFVNRSSLAGGAIGGARGPSQSSDIPTHHLL